MFKIITNRKLALVVTIVAIVALFIFLLSSRTPTSSTQSGKINIVGSFYPVSYAAGAVGGNLVSVRTLVPSGVEPHDFEPSSRDFVDIGNADILIYNGAGLEPWVQKWEAGTSIRPKHIINMSTALRDRGVVLLEKNGAVDPHFWVDPVVMKVEAEIIRDVLVGVDSTNQQIFIDNAKRLTNLLDVLDQRFRAGLTSCAIKNIIVGHEAFDYLGHRYGFPVTSISGISPDEEPAPKDLARIIALVKEKGVKYIFFETVASPKFSELIAREVGGGTLALNPLESLTPNEVQSGEDYVSIMETNLVNLQKAMSCTEGILKI
ncbi:MAG: zinc ABC transporter substrate-binding protein [Candidatus Paceibacterota bacterium]|jgi:zinc transport system substrate-binding protein